MRLKRDDRPDRSRRSAARRLGFSLLFAVVSHGRPAMADDLPLRNWEVPTQRHLTATGDLGNPGVFVPFTPCRILDTRNAAGSYGGPALAAATPRTITVNGNPGCTGIVAGALAYSVNLTVTNTLGAGFVQAYPAGGSAGGSSSVNYSGAGQTIANAAIVPAGTGGNANRITVMAGVSGTDLIIDVNGYFANPGVNANEQLAVSGSIAGLASIVGYNYSNADVSHGVGGFAGGSGVVHGVQGAIGTGAGPGASGVHGIGATTGGTSYGVLGETAAISVNSAAVCGNATGTTGVAYGVAGYSASSAGSAAGVLGSSSKSAGCGGMFVNTAAPVAQIYTYLATTGSPQGAPNGSYGVWVNGGHIFATGNIYGAAKNFVAPHPTDPSKEIVYTSVEAPTADIYFRGTALLTDGTTTIPVPEHFRLSAREESYQTSLTLVRAKGNASVESEGPEGIVVRGPAGATVHYVVYAERSSIEPQQAVRENVHFDAAALSRGDVRGLPATYLELLVRNGTLNPDLTLNRQTAERLGWTVPEGLVAK
jgi:hypothetical protein